MVRRQRSEADDRMQPEGRTGRPTPRHPFSARYAADTAVTEWRPESRWPKTGQKRRHSQGRQPACRQPASQGLAERARHEWQDRTHGESTGEKPVLERDFILPLGAETQRAAALSQTR